jgi:hypothetical protein
VDEDKSLSLVHAGMIIGSMATSYVSRKSCIALPSKNHFKKLFHRSLVIKRSPVKKEAIFQTVTVFRVERYAFSRSQWPCVKCHTEIMGSNPTRDLHVCVSSVFVLSM